MTLSKTLTLFGLALALCWSMPSGAQERARLGVDLTKNTGFLWLRGPDGTVRSNLGVDSLGQGYLILDGSNNIQRARLSIKNSNDMPFLRLYSTDGTTRTNLGVDSLGQGFLILDGSNDTQRARLSVHDNNDLPYFTLYGTDGTAPRALLDLDNAGRGRLILYGSNNAERVRLADSRLVLYDSGGAAAITLDGDTGNITKSGVNGFLVPHPADAASEIFYASLEGPEAGMFVRGTARLKDGGAEVTLPEHFSILARSDSITVQLTPNSADTRGLATVKKSSRGFEVRELAGGRGRFTFDYLVHATRQDVTLLKVVRPRAASGLAPRPSGLLPMVADDDVSEEPNDDVEATVDKEPADRETDPDRRKSEEVR